MGFTGNRCFKIVLGTTDWQTSSWITNFFEVFQMAVGVTGLAFGS
jgi:hypothetical protein